PVLAFSWRRRGRGMEPMEDISASPHQGLANQGGGNLSGPRPAEAELVETGGEPSPQFGTRGASEVRDSALTAAGHAQPAVHQTSYEQASRPQNRRRKQQLTPLNELPNIPKTSGKGVDLNEGEQQIIAN